MRHVFYICTAVLFASCGKDCLETNGRHFDEPFTLKVKECAEFALPLSSKGSNAVKVCFDEVITDDRCLLSHCHLCYGSLALIRMTLNDTSSVALSVVGCVGEVGDFLCHQPSNDTLGYRFCLLGLFPYPDHDNIPISQSDYSAKLIITIL